MKEYMPNGNRLADSANWLTDSDTLKFFKGLP